MPVSLYPLGKNPQYPLPIEDEALWGTEPVGTFWREREISYRFRVSNRCFSDV